MAILLLLKSSFVNCGKRVSSLGMADISLTSRYSSVVVLGMKRGNFFSFCLEQRTTVPMHVHRAGQRPSGPHSASSSKSSHLKSFASTSSMGTFCSALGDWQRRFPTITVCCFSQFDIQRKWQLQLRGLESKFSWARCLVFSKAPEVMHRIRLSLIDLNGANNYFNCFKN